MKKKLTALLVLCAFVATAGVTIAIKREGNNVRIEHLAQAGKNYSVVRYDINTGYYDTVTNYTASTNGLTSVLVDPNVPSDEDQPTPSGQCMFYLVEQ